MNPLRIVVLTDEHTPSYWSHGLVAALQTTLSVPVKVDTWIVTDAPSSPISTSSAVAEVLANTLLRFDRRFRRGAAASATGGTVPPPLRTPQRRRLGDDLSLEDIACVISTLSRTPELAASGLLGAGTVLWAESEGHVLGGSTHSFFRMLAEERWTIDISICSARCGGETRALLQSRCAVRSVAPSLNEELLAARVCDLLVLCAESVTADHIPPAAAEPVDEPSSPQQPAAITAPPVDVCTVFQVATRRVAALRRKGDSHLQWALGYRRTSGETVDESFRLLPGSEFLVPPPGTIWADPFPVHAEGCDLLFFEQEVKGEGRGHIAAAELLPDGRLGPVQRVIETPTHMSYPAVFRHEGAWFMVPESRAAGRVPLYRAKEFPFRWEWERDLFSSKRLADATVFERDGRWWMLACRVGAGASTFEDLVGYSADSLHGPWQPISSRPLISDATAGRPAGHMLETAAGILRPAQDGSRRYGYGLAIRRVTRLSTNEFAESEYLRVAPSWLPELRGIHTFNRSTTLTCIDVLRAVG